MESLQYESIIYRTYKKNSTVQFPYYKIVLYYIYTIRSKNVLQRMNTAIMVYLTVQILLLYIGQFKMFISISTFYQTCIHFFGNDHVPTLDALLFQQT